MRVSEIGFSRESGMADSVEDSSVFDVSVKKSAISLAVSSTSWSWRSSNFPRRVQWVRRDSTTAEEPPWLLGEVRVES